MRANTTASGLSVSLEVVHAAAAGVQEAWDTIVDTYAGLVWAVARRHQLSGWKAADVSQLTWLRFRDRLAIISPEAIAGWLADTAERECIRLVRLSGVGGEAQVSPA
jgi:DNA-directed RNA polymerase specialized sigma24 family protein